MKDLKYKFIPTLILLDIVVIIATLFFSYYLRASDFALTFLAPVSDTYVGEWILFEYSLKFVALFLFSAFVVGLYRFSTVTSPRTQLKRVFKTVCLCFFLLVSYYFFKRSFVFSRFVMLFTFMNVFVILAITRLLCFKLYKYLSNTQRYIKKVLVVTSTKKLFEKFLEQGVQAGGCKIVGYFAPRDLKISGETYLGKLSVIESKLQKTDFDSFYQLGAIDSQVSEWLLDYCRFRQKSYYFLADLYLNSSKHLISARIGDLDLLKLNPTTIYLWPALFKRLFDIVVSLFLIVILSPVFLVVAILIKLDSKGTIFFKYLDNGEVIKRVGLHQKRFYMYKFRSMAANSHSLRYTKLKANNTRNGSPLVKIKNDPRITTLGLFLRKYDIDELPQLWNVLKGDMSLVGPRPHLPEEVQLYQKHHNFVFTIKPGMTGLPQVSGRCSLDFEKEVELDTYYIENWSFFLDLKILLKTFLVVIKGK